MRFLRTTADDRAGRRAQQPSGDRVTPRTPGMHTDRYHHPSAKFSLAARLRTRRTEPCRERRHQSFWAPAWLIDLPAPPLAMWATLLWPNGVRKARCSRRTTHSGRNSYGDSSKVLESLWLGPAWPAAHRSARNQLQRMSFGVRQTPIKGRRWLRRPSISNRMGALL